MPIIRPYQPSDYGACRALWVELVQHHRDIYEDQSINADDPGAELDVHLQRPDLACVLVAEEDGAVRGLSGLLVDGEEGQIEPVIVSSEFRGGGLGALLLDAVTAEARRRGVRFLGLKPVGRNERAIALFVREGFDILGYVELFKVLPDNDPRTWRDDPGLLKQGVRS